MAARHRPIADPGWKTRKTVQLGRWPLGAYTALTVGFLRYRAVRPEQQRTGWSLAAIDSDHGRHRLGMRSVSG